MSVGFTPTTRREAAPPPDLTRDKVWEMERPRHAQHSAPYQKSTQSGVKAFGAWTPIGAKSLPLRRSSMRVVGSPLWDHCAWTAAPGAHCWPGPWINTVASHRIGAIVPINVARA